MVRTSLGGFSRDEVLFLYGAAGLAFTLCDLFVSNLDRISQHIKAGTLDTFLIRPVSPWIQIATDRFVPTRFGLALLAGFAWRQGIRRYRSTGS